MLQGTVQFYNRSRDHGVIIIDGNAGSINVDTRAMRASRIRSIGPGTRLEFLIKTGRDGRQRAVELRWAFMSVANESLTSLASVLEAAGGSCR